MFNNNLVLCGAASGSGYEPEISIPVILSTSSVFESKAESLELAVAFGTLDVIGSILTLIPEPTCQVIGHCCALPSRTIWLYQCYKLARLHLRN
jgi:hypothetical protein